MGQLCVVKETLGLVEEGVAQVVRIRSRDQWAGSPLISKLVLTLYRQIACHQLCHSPDLFTKTCHRHPHFSRCINYIHCCNIWVLEGLKSDGCNSANYCCATCIIIHYRVCSPKTYITNFSRCWRGQPHDGFMYHSRSTCWDLSAVVPGNAHLSPAFFKGV